MYEITVKEKSYKLKFAYTPTLKGRLLSKLANQQKDLSESEGNLLNIEDLMLFLPEMLLIALQRNHRDEFGYNYDTEEGKDEKLALCFDIIDDYCDEGGDLMELYTKLNEELEKDSFLSKMFHQAEAKAKKQK